MRKKSDGHLAAFYHEPCEKLRIADLEAKLTEEAGCRTASVRLG